MTSKNQTSIMIIKFIITVLLVSMNLVASLPQSNISHINRIHRIVAVGDIHGDLTKFQNIIALTEKLGAGFDSQTFIQVGDLVDRGDNDKGCLDLAFSLFEESNTNKKVVLLLGNHELLNIESYFHYVHGDDFSGFVNKQMRKLAFDVNGPYGGFIAENFLAAYIAEENLFVHAGFDMSSNYQEFSIDELNKAVKTALRDRQFRDPLLATRGPLWSRKMVLDAIHGDCKEVNFALQHFGVKRIVVGHTPERDGHIGVYCGGNLFAIDVGISRWMYDSFAFLEIIVAEGSNKEQKILETSFWEINAHSKVLLYSHTDVQKSDDFPEEDL